MSTIRVMDIIEWMVTEAGKADLRLVSILSGAIYRDSQSLPETVREVIAETDNLKAELAKVGGPAWRRKFKAEQEAKEVKRVAKKAAKKYYYKHKTLAEVKTPKGGTKKPHPSVQPKGKHGPRAPNGPGVKVMSALTQTSGKIGVGELAEVLEMDANLVNATLAYQYKVHSKVNGLHRELVKPPGQRAHYVYWLEGGKS